MRRRKSRLPYVYIALAGAMFFGLFGESTAHAQTALAALSGQVFDPSGRAVPAADVLATNTDTGVATDTKTIPVLYKRPRQGVFLF